MRSIRPTAALLAALAACFLCAASRASAQSCSPNWVPLMRHDARGGVFPTDTPDINPLEPEALLFASTSQLEDFRTPGGEFILRLVWDGLCDTIQCINDRDYIIWAQTSNPFNSSAITGYRPEDVYYDDFGGLALGSFAVLDGAPGFRFWYSVGATELFNRQIPGPILTGHSQGVLVDSVALYVMNTTMFVPDSCALYEDCLDNGMGGHTCNCSAGFVRGIESGTCIDIDECALGTKTCALHASCFNTFGSAACKCDEGFYGDPDGEACFSDICDMHQLDNGTNTLCHEHASCQTLEEGGYMCVCDVGYIGDGIMACNDTNECDLDICHQNASCTNTDGSFFCTCQDGYDGDGITCEVSLVVWLDADDYVENSTVWVDRSVLGNHGMVNPEATLYEPNGTFFKHFVFTGSDEQELVRVLYDISANNHPDLTIEALFLPIEAVGFGAVVDGDNGGYDRHLDFGPSTEVLYGPGAAMGSGSPYTVGGNTIKPRCWQHAFAVFSQGSQRASFTYLNGIEGHRTTALNGHSPENFTIGGSLLYNGGLNGFVRRVKVYNRTLSVDEIHKKYLDVKPELHCECIEGFRGVEVTGCLDIDECAEETDTCHPTRGVCTNVPGSYNCTCMDGFFGDGRTCSPIGDCAVSEWEDVSECDAFCGVGSKVQTRTILREPTNGGAECPTLLNRTVSCIVRDCMDVDTDTFNVVLIAPAASVDVENSTFAQLNASVVGADSMASVAIAAIATEFFDEDSGTFVTVDGGEVQVQALLTAPVASVAAISGAISAIMGTRVVLFDRIDGCYCDAEILGGSLWLGAACGELSVTRHACPGSVDPLAGLSDAEPIRRNCSGLTRTFWAKPDAAFCNSTVLRDIADGISTTEDLSGAIAAALNVTRGGSSASLGMADVAALETIILSIIDRVTSFDLTPLVTEENEDEFAGIDLTNGVAAFNLTVEDIVNFVTLYSDMLGADEDVVMRGLASFGALTGAGITVDVEDFLAYFTEKGLLVDETLSVVAPNFATDLYHVNYAPINGSSWPPEGSRAAVSTYCYGHFTEKICSVVAFGSDEVNFDAALTISVPRDLYLTALYQDTVQAAVDEAVAEARLIAAMNALNQSLEAGDTRFTLETVPFSFSISDVVIPTVHDLMLNFTMKRPTQVLIGAYALPYLFASIDSLRGMSQTVFATVHNLPTLYNISATPVRFDATPEHYNGTDGAACAVWVPGSWDATQCTLLNGNVSEGAYQCSCTHLTTFGIVELIPPQPSFVYPTKEDYFLALIAFAIIILVVTFLILLLRRKLYSHTRVVVMHQAISLALFLLLLVSTMDEVDNDTCKYYGVALHYLLALFYAWVLNGALLAFFKAKRMWPYVLFGYVAAAIVVGVTAGLHLDDYTRTRPRIDPNKHCFIPTGEAIEFSVFGPIAGFAGVAVIIFFSLLMSAICCYPSIEKQDVRPGEPVSSRSMAVTMMFLSLVLTLLAACVGVAFMFHLNGEDDTFWPVVSAASSIAYAVLLFVVFALPDYVNVFFCCMFSRKAQFDKMNEGIAMRRMRHGSMASGDFDLTKSTSQGSSIAFGELSSLGSTNTLRILPRKIRVPSVRRISKQSSEKDITSTSQPSSEGDIATTAFSSVSADGAKVEENSLYGEFLDLDGDADVPLRFTEADPVVISKSNFDALEADIAKIRSMVKTDDAAGMEEFEDMMAEMSDSELESLQRRLSNTHDVINGEFSDAPLDLADMQRLGLISHNDESDDDDDDNYDGRPRRKGAARRGSRDSASSADAEFDYGKPLDRTESSNSYAPGSEYLQTSGLDYDTLKGEYLQTDGLSLSRSQAAPMNPLLGMPPPDIGEDHNGRRHLAVPYLDLDEAREVPRDTPLASLAVTRSPTISSITPPPRPDSLKSNPQAAYMTVDGAFASSGLLLGESGNQLIQGSTKGRRRSSATSSLTGDDEFDAVQKALRSQMLQQTITEMDREEEEEEAEEERRRNAGKQEDEVELTKF